MYRPGALVLAKVLADFPILVFQITAFVLLVFSRAFRSPHADAGPINQIPTPRILSLWPQDLRSRLHDALEHVSTSASSSLPCFRVRLLR